MDNTTTIAGNIPPLALTKRLSNRRVREQAITSSKRGGWTPAQPGATKPGQSNPIAIKPKLLKLHNNDENGV